MQYVGEYRSAITSSSGCVMSFMTEPEEENLFDASVQYTCPLCDGMTHSFRLITVHLVGTESQNRALQQWCDAHDVPRGIKLP